VAQDDVASRLREASSSVGAVPPAVTGVKPTGQPSKGLNGQTRDLSKMLVISRDQAQTFANRRGGDLDVTFRDKTAFAPEFGGNSSKLHGVISIER